VRDVHNSPLASPQKCPELRKVHSSANGVKRSQHQVLSSRSVRWAPGVIELTWALTVIRRLGVVWPEPPSSGQLGGRLELPEIWLWTSAALYRARVRRAELAASESLPRDRGLTTSTPLRRSTPAPPGPACRTLASCSPAEWSQF